jgi:DNA mismatch endonuclease (patch repair protein)
MDHINPSRRSWLMSRVKAKGTTPEMRVRRAAHALGFRFRLHQRKLPGSPDLVFPKLNSLIFVHGCFWHRHSNCSKASMPQTRQEFWNDKFQRNVARDALVQEKLQELGWRVLVIWECQTKEPRKLRSKLRNFLKQGQ